MTKNRVSYCFFCMFMKSFHFRDSPFFSSGGVSDVQGKNDRTRDEELFCGKSISES